MGCGATLGPRKGPATKRLLEEETVTDVVASAQQDPTENLKGVVPNHGPSCGSTVVSQVESSDSDRRNGAAAPVVEHAADEHHIDGQEQSSKYPPLWAGAEAEGLEASTQRGSKSELQITLALLLACYTEACSDGTGQAAPGERL
mmetsp:Transcript_44605/g.83778  ORF Transcript_44605/g.83778 Transcript_44605/m.83778 type:complete len:145 (+) Transcript_44605:89-523(+)